MKTRTGKLHLQKYQELLTEVGRELMIYGLDLPTS